MLTVVFSVLTRRAIVLTLGKKYGALTGVRDIFFGFYLGGVFIVPEMFDSRIGK